MLRYCAGAGVKCSWSLRGSNLCSKSKYHGTRSLQQLDHEYLKGLRRVNPYLCRMTESHSEKLKELEKKLQDGQVFSTEQQVEYSRLSSIVGTYEKYKEGLNSISSLSEMIEDDPALKGEAEAELRHTIPEVNLISDKLVQKLLPPHPFAGRACLMEIRPGVGGSEAMIFAQDLLDMYIKYAAYKRWAYRVVEKSQSDIKSGITNAVLSIDQLGSYDTLKYEAGVHRVQRIPATETKGRTHTSTAAIVVLPQMGDDSEKVMDAYERTFKPDEIRVDYKRASGKGGQHVNTTDSAVRLTHYPTGIVISMQDERSQHKNKAKAFALLRAKLAEYERVERENKERAVKKAQVTTTDRSDKIKTYNYPQNRITDHRCGFSLHDIPGVMSGSRLDEMIEEMAKFDVAQKAKALIETAG